MPMKQITVIFNNIWDTLGTERISVYAANSKPWAQSLLMALIFQHQQKIKTRILPGWHRRWKGFTAKLTSLEHFALASNLGSPRQYSAYTSAFKQYQNRLCQIKYCNSFHKIILNINLPCHFRYMCHYSPSTCLLHQMLIFNINLSVQAASQKCRIQQYNVQMPILSSKRLFNISDLPPFTCSLHSKKICSNHNVNFNLFSLYY